MKSSNDIQLFTKNYLVDSPVASILIVHGLHEHCLRYAHVAQAFNDQNINVYTFDLRGHGKSGGNPQFVTDIDEYREDLENIYRSIPKVVPLFLLGHSMGGLIATHFLLYQERRDIVGVVLSGAALEVGEDISPLTQKIVGFLGKRLPHLKTAKLNTFYVSRDPEEVAKYEADPMIYKGGAKAGLGLALLNAIKSIQPKFNQFDFPVLVMHGGSDKITAPQGSKMLYERASSLDKTLKIWEDSYHEIFNEINKKEVIDYTIHWVKSRVIK